MHDLSHIFRKSVRVLDSLSCGRSFVVYVHRILCHVENVSSDTVHTRHSLSKVRVTEWPPIGK